MDAITPNASPDIISPLKGMVHNQNISEQAKLKKASQQFEAMLLKQILEDGLKPMIKGALPESGGSHTMYQHLISDALSQQLSESESFGIAQSIQLQMKNRIK